MTGRSVTDGVVVVALAACGVVFAVGAVRARLSLRRFIGRPPIALPVFLLGKLSMIGCWTILLGQALGVPLVAAEAPVWARWTGAALVVLATAFIIPSGIGLGAAEMLGLPADGSGGADEAALVTRGIYRVSRNPMYVGFCLVCAASCFYSPHVLVPLLAGVGVAVQHAVVLAEERYLSRRHGRVWADYSSRVRRYL